MLPLSTILSLHPYATVFQTIKLTLIKSYIIIYHFDSFVGSNHLPSVNFYPLFNYIKTTHFFLILMEWCMRDPLQIIHIWFSVMKQVVHIKAFLASVWPIMKDWIYVFRFFSVFIPLNKIWNHGVLWYTEFYELFRYSVLDTI